MKFINSYFSFNLATPDFIQWLGMTIYMHFSKWKFYLSKINFSRVSVVIVGILLFRVCKSDRCHSLLFIYDSNTINATKHLFCLWMSGCVYLIRKLSEQEYGTIYLEIKRIFFYKMQVFIQIANIIF